MPHEEAVRAARPGTEDLPGDEARVEPFVAGAAAERLKIGSDDGPIAEPLPQAGDAALDQVASPVGPLRLPGAHRVDVEHRGVDLDVVDPRLEVLAEAAGIAVAVSRQPEDVHAQGDVNRQVDALEQLDEELRAGRSVLGGVARVLRPVVHGEADVVELDLVEAEVLGLLGELDDHRVVVTVVGVEPRAAGSPAHPRLVASHVEDRPLGVPRRKLRIGEASHPRDRVDAGLLQARDEGAGVTEVAALLRLEDRDGRVVGDPTLAVLEIDDDRVGAGPLHEGQDIVEPMPAKVIAGEVDPRRSLPPRRDRVVELSPRRGGGPRRAGAGGARGISTRSARREGHPHDHSAENPRPPGHPHHRSPQSLRRRSRRTAPP